MSLTREDKVWLSKLAALVVRAISETIVGDFKTAISVNRTKDIIKFGREDRSDYLVKPEGAA